MKKRIALASFLAGLSGCATTTAVSQLGPDTFTVSGIAAPAAGGPPQARAMALEKANSYCASMDKSILVTADSARTTNAYGSGAAYITFRCLGKGDKDLKRPDYEAPPSAVIEDRRR